MKNKKLAILIYENFSVKEISDLMFIFRWYGNTMTEIISSTYADVISEEGMVIKPNKSVDDFIIDDYFCLVLPGCSDFKHTIQDTKLINFFK